MKFIVSAVAIAVMVVACGGGGGSAGDKIGSGSGSSGSNPASKVGSMTLKMLTGITETPQEVSGISASERTARIQVAFKDPSGKAKAGEIVTFTEEGSGLLTFSPESATALTDSNGIAEIDVAAASLNSLGATKIVATSDVVTVSKNIAVTAAVTPDINPQALVQSVGFVSASPDSIVIAGSGGSGRSETSILQFKVVDNAGLPVKGAAVDFAVIPDGAVQLNIASAKSNNDGIVTTSVSSKAQATAVIVKATVLGTAKSTQSSELTVTTDLATQGGFDLSASKYNLDADTSGDSSSIRVAIVDRNGNPVADGVPVLATADFGRVGTSNRGGCTTANGVCTVEYQVQNPRPVGGGPVRVTFSTQTGASDIISDSLTFWVTSAGDGDFYNSVRDGSIVTSMNLSGAANSQCKFTWSGFLGTPNGFALPAGTTVTLKSRGSVVQGTADPVLDRQSTRTPVTVAFTLTDADVAGSEQVEFTLTQGQTVKKNCSRLLAILSA